MAQNRPLLLALLGGLVLGVVGAASLREGEPGPEEVAIRAGTVEVTFGELDLLREGSRATRPVTERLMAGEDFGMPPDGLDAVRAIQAIMAPLRDDSAEELELVAQAASAAAARDRAAALGLDPSESDLAQQVDTILRMEARLLASDAPETALPRAFMEAGRAALGERYEREYLPLRTRDNLARQALVRGIDLAPSELGSYPIMMGWEAALEADLWVHPSLGVSSEQVRDHLERHVRLQQAMRVLQEAMLVD